MSMNRRDVLKMPLAVAAQARPAKRNRPNILFLMTDQQRGDCVGADVW